MAICNTTLSDSLFCVKDNVSGALSFFSVSSSRGAFVRSVLPMIRVPLKDVEPCVVLSYGSSDDSIQLETFSWDVYKYPETKMESLAPLNLSDDEKKQLVEAEEKNK